MSLARLISKKILEFTRIFSNCLPTTLDIWYFYCIKSMSSYFALKYAHLNIIFVTNAIFNFCSLPLHYLLNNCILRNKPAECVICYILVYCLHNTAAKLRIKTIEGTIQSFGYISMVCRFYNI